MIKHSEQFKQEAVRIALTSGLPRARVASDLGVGERRVGRLMRINGIKPVRTRKHKVTTNSHHSLGIAPNILDGDFAADMPNRKWAGDISYIWTHEGWLYLAVILDLHSRRVFILMRHMRMLISCSVGQAASKKTLRSKL